MPKEEKINNDLERACGDFSKRLRGASKETSDDFSKKLSQNVMRNNWRQKTGGGKRKSVSGDDLEYDGPVGNRYKNGNKGPKA